MKPRIIRFMEKNTVVKCPHCGWTNRVSKTDRIFKCRRCGQFIEMDKEYQVDKYY